MSDDVKALIAKARGLGGLSSTVQAVVDSLADALEASVQAPLQCPHWEPGKLTERQRCTACEAVQAPAGLSRKTLSYAATALEASDDNGDRYCARQIREHLAEASVQAPAVDREALARHFYMRNSGRSASDFDYLMKRHHAGHDGLPEMSFVEADALIASGILQDAAEVEARGLEKAADAEADWTARAWRPEEAETVVKLRNGLRARAQQVREAIAPVTEEAER